MRHDRIVAVLLAALALSAAGVRADQSWTVPGIVHADGLNGTHFVSDLTLTNPGEAAAHVTLSYFPSAQPPKVLTLGPGQTSVAPDVAFVHFGITSGAGGLSISSDQPLLVRAKTYNTAPSGTYGVSLPVVSSDRLLATGDVADSLWITQDASGSTGYRTNVAVVFPDDAGGEATVTVYDADGNAVGSQDYSRDAAGLQQFAVGSFAGTVPIGRAQIQVTRGTAAGYSVVVDNVTGDSSLFAFEQLPAGWQDVLVNGVARANGRNNTFFRTDGRFYNPAPEDAKVTVSFHANQSDNSSAVSRDFTVPAGKILDVVDVLDSLLGLPVGSSGALRFHSESPVAILCRTSNVDPSGSRPGTFGAQQKPTPFPSFLTSGDAGAVVTGVRQNAAFRTNVGFAAGADGAAYALTLKTPGGATVATSSGSLGVFGWTQPSVQDLFSGVTIPDDATLLVKVTSGSVDVYDSSIDNASGDPVVTPIAPLPAAIPSSATIGPEGGSIRSDDGALTLRIPAGALGAPTPMSIATVANDAPGALGAAYDVSPGGLAFAKPALLSLRYGGAGVPADGIDAVSLAVLGSTGWGGLTGGRIDTTSRSLVIPLSNTSPPLATFGARTSQAAPQPTRVAPVQSLLVDRQDWLPTGGKMILQVKVQVTETSSAGDTVTVIPLKPGSPAEDVKWWNPSLGSINTKAGPTTTYTAPATINGAFTVVTMSVQNTDHGTNSSVGQTFKFRVIRRKWKLTVLFDVNLECVGSNGDFSASYADIAEQLFHFNDDLTFLPDSGAPGTSQTSVAVGSCDPVCKAAVAAAPSVISLTNVGGTFLRTTGFLVMGTASVTNATPTVALTCDHPFEDRSRTVKGENYSALVPALWILSNNPQKSPSAPKGAPAWLSAQWESVP